MDSLEYEALVKEIFSDEEYVLTLVAMDTPEEVAASLNAKGLPITTEEVIQVRDLLIAQGEGELSDEDLEDISGGCGLVAAGIGVLFTALTIVGMGVAEGVTRGRW